MIVLGIDTSDSANVIGLVDDGKVLADYTFEVKTDSLKKIITNIDAVIQKVGLTPEGIEGIGVGLGPGSWTGIRIGVTVGKIIALSTNKPVYGVSTLEALAYSARGKDKLICAIVGAGTGDIVYAALYRTEDDSVKRDGDYYVGSVKGLAGVIEESVVLVGHGASLYGETIDKEMVSQNFDITVVDAIPNGAIIAEIAAKHLEYGEKNDVLGLTPLYLKESTAKTITERVSDHR